MDILFITQQEVSPNKIAEIWEKNGHTVKRYHYRKYRDHKGLYTLSTKSKKFKEAMKKLATKEVQKIVDDQSPDLIFSIKSELIQMEKIETDAEKILWFPDDPQMFRESKKLSKGYNKVLTNSKEVLDNYPIQSFFFPFGVDIELYEDDKIRKNYDIAFIGRHSSKRERYIETLADLEIDIIVGGPDWPNLDGVKREKKWLSDREMIDIYERSRLSLNLVKTREHITKRVFESNATNSAVLTEEMVGIEKFYDKGELETFKDKDTMKSKLKSLLKNNERRKAISEKGKEKTKRNYKYEDAADKILSISEN